jgi:hypothetical protein
MNPKVPLLHAWKRTEVELLFCYVAELWNQSRFYLDLHPDIPPRRVKVSHHVELDVLNDFHFQFRFGRSLFQALAAQQFEGERYGGLPVEVPVDRLENCSSGATAIPRSVSAKRATSEVLLARAAPTAFAICHCGTTCTW